MANLGWLSGLGAGLSSGSQRFIDTQLAKQQMELYQQQEAMRMQGEMRSEQQWQEQKRIQKMEEKMMEQQEKERLLEKEKLQATADRIRPQLNEIMGWEVPEETPPKYVLSWMLKAMEARSRGVKDEVYPSLIMTKEDALNMIENSQYPYDATDGKKYQVYPQYIFDVAKKWGISTEGMRTEAQVKTGLKKEFGEVDDKKAEPTLWQKGWQKVFGGGEKAPEVVGPPEQIGDIENPQWREVFAKAVSEGWSTEKIRELYKEFQATYGQ